MASPTPEAAATRVLIVDDHPVVRQGLRAFFDTQPDIVVVGEAADGAEAVARAGDLAPDVVLLDLLMPGPANSERGGLWAIGGILAARPGARILVLSSFADEDNVLAAIRAGAAGYLLKEVAPAELAAAVRAVARGESPLHPLAAAGVVRGVRQGGATSGLTPRELDVLRLLAAGEPNKRIARSLAISEKTVKTHVSAILAKFGVADRTQAALYAVRTGLLGP